MAERQSARVSKITNDGLTRLHSCTHMVTVHGRQMVNYRPVRMPGVGSVFWRTKSLIQVLNVLCYSWL